MDGNKLATDYKKQMAMVHKIGENYRWVRQWHWDQFCYLVESEAAQNDGAYLAIVQEGGKEFLCVDVTTTEDAMDLIPQEQKQAIDSNDPYWWLLEHIKCFPKEFVSDLVCELYDGLVETKEGRPYTFAMTLQPQGDDSEQEE